MRRPYLPPDNAHLRSPHRLGSAIHERRPLSQIPLRLIGVADAVEREQAHIRVRVALATLVADVTGFDIDYCNQQCLWRVGCVIRTAVALCVGHCCEMCELWSL